MKDISCSRKDKNKLCNILVSLLYLEEEEQQQIVRLPTQKVLRKNNSF